MYAVINIGVDPWECIEEVFETRQEAIDYLWYIYLDGCRDDGELYDYDKDDIEDFFEDDRYIQPVFPRAIPYLSESEKKELNKWFEENK